MAVHRKGEKYNKKIRDKYNPKLRRIQYLKYKFGLTPDQWTARLRQQDNACACCGSKKPKHTRGWVGDHDHQTGKFRGILCHPCNVVIGMLGDSRFKIERKVAKIRKYLRSSNGSRLL